MSEFRVKAGKLDYFLVSEKAWGKKKKKKSTLLKSFTYVHKPTSH